MFELPEELLDVDLPSEERLFQLAEDTLAQARERSLTLGTAESLTGGLIAAQLTSVSGSSDVFLGGVVSYAYSVKSGVLGVSEERLATEGAVDSLVASQMARGACDVIHCDYAVAVTGIAGPGGAEPGKPVGTVWMSVAHDDESVERRFEFAGNRHMVREKTTYAALCMLRAAIME